MSISLALPTTALAGLSARGVLSLRPRAAAPLHGVPQVSSQSLLAGGRELVIEHQGQQYHLRLTRNDKLILTK